jgi:hypothetical protein
VQCRHVAESDNPFGVGGIDHRLYFMEQMYASVATTATQYGANRIIGQGHAHIAKAVGGRATVATHRAKSMRHHHCPIATSFDGLDSTIDESRVNNTCRRHNGYGIALTQMTRIYYGWVHRIDANLWITV